MNSFYDLILFISLHRTETQTLTSGSAADLSHFLLSNLSSKQKLNVCFAAVTLYIKLKIEMLEEINIIEKCAWVKSSGILVYFTYISYIFYFIAYIIIFDTFPVLSCRTHYLI